MIDYETHLASDRRLCILKLLFETGGTANESVLHNGLDMLGHRRQPRSVIRDDLQFLVKNGLIIVEWFSEVMVCTITRRGVECAEGRIHVAGVKRPAIGV
jgi:hypothetical protein